MSLYTMTILYYIYTDNRAYKAESTHKFYIYTKYNTYLH